MRIHSWFFILLGTGVTFAGWGCEDDVAGTSSGVGATQGQPCDREEDCEDNNPCTYEFCVEDSGGTGKTCRLDPIDGEENPEAMQIGGDCQIIGCTEGVEATLPSDDPPEDPNDDCNLQICMEGVVTPALKEVGDGCFENNMGGVCSPTGVCSCVLTPGQPAFVNPVEGIDSAQNGGGQGSCAFKTLSYALGVAEGAIILAPGVYDTAGGESPPYVLAGTQRINCEGDGMGNNATLDGGGSFSGTTTVVALTGATNSVQDCVIIGGGAAHAVAVASDSGGGHNIENNDISGATNGITVLAAGDNPQINDNNIHNNSGTGVNFVGTAKQGNINDNTFTANLTDIACADASENIMGGGNNVASCQVCMNCPF